MPTLNGDRYQLLRCQILANAYLLYPKKGQRLTSAAGGTGSAQPSTRRGHASMQSSHSKDPPLPTQLSEGSLASSLANVEVWPTKSRDLEVAVCCHLGTATLSEPMPAFYAVVYDKNECSGYDRDEQDAQITRQRHKLKSHVLTTRPEDACETEEGALMRLCRRLEVEASQVVMGNTVVVRHDDDVREGEAGIFGSFHKAKYDGRGVRRGSNGMQDVQPTGSQVSLHESLIETEVDSSSQQQRLLALARQDSFNEAGSSPAFENMITRNTQPTQAIAPGNHGPYHNQLRRE